MKDRALNASLSAYTADGALYPLPNNFAGDYLAVADANIGGGKTDRFIKQQVDLAAHLDLAPDHRPVGPREARDRRSGAALPASAGRWA